MIDNNKRRIELMDLFHTYGTEAKIIDAIITQEQSMIKKLEADYREPYNRGYADGHSDMYDYYNNPNSKKYKTIQEKLKDSNQYERIDKEG
jgi:hypothetical protein